MFTIDRALNLAAHIGIPISEFWAITPHELSIYACAHNDKIIESHNNMVTQAYMISRWVWAKNLDINKYLHKDKKQTMSDDDMLTRAKEINAAMGGIVEYKQG